MRFLRSIVTALVIYGIYRHAPIWFFDMNAEIYLDLRLMIIALMILSGTGAIVDFFYALFTTKQQKDEDK